MARQNSEAQKTRTLRKAETRARNGLPLANAIALGALVEVLSQYSRGVYISQPTATGGVRIKVYGGEEALETYLASNDSPEEVLSELCEEAAGPIVAELWGRAWEARRAERLPEVRSGASEGESTTPPTRKRS